MELDLQSLFELQVLSCTYWLRPRKPPLPPPPHLGSYTRRHWSAKTDDISLRPPGLHGLKRGGTAIFFLIQPDFFCLMFNES
jgi:hypothetical protein